jgi:hypothetical protein
MLVVHPELIGTTEIAAAAAAVVPKNLRLDSRIFVLLCSFMDYRFLIG